jgi:hypothetical protein
MPESGFNICIFGSRPRADLLPPEVEIDPYDRWWLAYERLLARQIPDLKPTCLISGAARGADIAGEIWADHTGVAVYKHPPDWRAYGKGAGFVRNTQMAHLATHFLALWDGESRGTQHMIQTVRELKKPLIIIRLDRRMFE